MRKQLAFMLGRQQVFLNLETEDGTEVTDSEDLVDIMSNNHLNSNFLALGREVGMVIDFMVMIGNCVGKASFSSFFLILCSWTLWNPKCLRTFTRPTWSIHVCMCFLLLFLLLTVCVHAINIFFL